MDYMNHQLSLRHTKMGQVKFLWENAKKCGDTLSLLAVNSLIDEVKLTPKPALVDSKSNGAHKDLNIDLMLRSANSLKKAFRKMAETSFMKEPSVELLNELSSIGKDGEKAMFSETSGINTHKGAIWSLGLLISAIAMENSMVEPYKIAETAGKLARLKTTLLQDEETNGMKVKKIFGVNGARGEAEEDFIHVTKFALPCLQNARSKGLPENEARLDALVSLISELDDTCLLHRGGIKALSAAKESAKRIIMSGGTSTKEGFIELMKMDEKLLLLNASPGGSADLLAATLLIDSYLNLKANI